MEILYKIVLAILAFYGFVSNKNHGDLSIIIHVTSYYDHFARFK